MSNTKVNNKESETSGKSVKPKKPLPTQKEPIRLPVPCSALTEEQVREIVKDEIIKYVKETTKRTLPIN